MFAEDLPEGKRHEAIVLEMIRRKYPRAYMTNGLFKAGDIVIPEIGEMVEIKFDRMSDKTDNFFIETNCNGELSGISTTGSKWWAIMDAHYLTWITVDVIWEIIRTHNLKKRQFKYRMNGETDVEGYLIPRDYLYYSPYTLVINYEN